MGLRTGRGPPTRPRAERRRPPPTRGGRRAPPQLAQHGRSTAMYRPPTFLRLMLMLVVGSLVVSVALAAAQGAQNVRGGVAFVNGGDVDWVDPALDYVSFGWQIEYVTCAQLVNYPDAAVPGGSQLQPEVAKSYAISADGLTYSFALRNDYRFSPPSN